jgi:hypothetical protein
VLDHGPLGDADRLAGELEPQPQVDVLARPERLVERVPEEQLAAHERRADAEPAAHAARVVVRRQRLAPVITLADAVEARLDALEAALGRLVEEAAEGVGLHEHVRVDEGDPRVPRQAQAELAAGGDAGPVVVDDGVGERSGEACGPVRGRSVHDDDLVRVVGAERLQAGDDPALGIPGGYDDADRQGHGLASLPPTSRAVARASGRRRCPSSGRRA